MVRALRRGRHEARRQPQHALRPVDARAQDAPRPRRARRAGRRPDRDERPAALAGVHQAVRPDRAPEHVDPPPRRLPLPVRRPGADPRLASATTRATTSRTRTGWRSTSSSTRTGCGRSGSTTASPGPTTASSGASRGRRGSRRARSAGRTTRRAARRRSTGRPRGDGRRWERPRWEERWFPQAFKGTMGQLMRAIQEDAEPEISGRDDARDDGAGRGGVPLGAARAGRSPLAETMPAERSLELERLPSRRARRDRHRRRRRARRRTCAARWPRPAPRSPSSGARRRRSTRSRDRSPRRGGTAISVVCRRLRARRRSTRWPRRSWQSSAASTSSSTTPRSTRAGPWTEITEEEWDAVLGTNLKGYFLCARAAYPSHEGARPRPDRQRRLDHLLRRLRHAARLRLVEGRDRRLHARARARDRAGGDHRQRDLAGRVPDRRREDPSRPGGLQPAGSSTSRASSGAARRRTSATSSSSSPSDASSFITGPDRSRSTAAG